MNRRSAIFGGSFDPVHNAHVALAQAALQELQLDELRWIPAGAPWQKERVIADATHRVAMLQLAIAREARFVLDRIEIERAGNSFTLDTVRALAREHAHTQWFLLIGQDQYTNLHTWRDWQSLLGLVTLAVANRPGERAAPHPQVQAFAHRMVPLPMLDISSTDIRQRIAAGADIASLVPPPVARYIETHRLYAGTPGS